MEFFMQAHSFTTKTGFGELEISGYGEYGFTSAELLVSSIAGCSGGVLRKVFEKKRIEYNDIKINADVVRNSEGAREITSIHLHFVLKGVGASVEKVKKSLEVTKKNCSMVQSVKGSIDVSESFEIVND